MSDEDLRKLRREAASGDPAAILGYVDAALRLMGHHVPSQAGWPAFTCHTARSSAFEKTRMRDA
jgi:hypothetical protein